MGFLDKVLEDVLETGQLPLFGPGYVKDDLFDDILKDLGAYNPSSTVLEGLDEGSCLHIDLPGVLKEDIQMDVDEQGVRVKAERKGFKAQTYTKSYKLPKGTDLDKVCAKYENGVLRIHLPEAEKQKSKSIKIS